MSDDGFFAFLERLGEDSIDRKQRESIEALELRAASNRLDQQSTDNDVARLRAEVTALTREIASMKVAFGVLSHLLVDTGRIDAAVLDARLAEAQARAAAVKPVVSSAVCSNCKMSYLGSQLFDSATGPLCKRCRAVGG